MNIEDQLDAIFRDVLELGQPIDHGELVYNEFPKWNSLAHMGLVSAIEANFDVILETDDILNMSSFDKAVAIVKKYRADN
jgi:acyl carrier protein